MTLVILLKIMGSDKVFILGVRSVMYIGITCSMWWVEGVIMVCGTKLHGSVCLWEKLGYVNVPAYGPCIHHLKYSKIPSV
jgi:hypothetical protein